MGNVLYLLTVLYYLQNSKAIFIKNHEVMFSDSIDIKEVEISGEAVGSFMSGFPEYLADIALTALHTHDIDTPEPGKWYSLNNCLKVLDEIGSKFGSDTLYAIGKEALKCALLPQNLKSLKDVIEKLEDAFKLNHRNMQICWVTLENYDIRAKRVVLFIENPYPLEINRGILTGIARQYNPIPDKIPEVTIDEENSLLSKGKYIISW